MSVKHAPGPWQWSGGGQRALIDANAATILYDDSMNGMGAADRALVAAAPEMLALLRKHTMSPEMGVDSARHCMACGAAEGWNEMGPTPVIHGDRCAVATLLARIDGEP